MPSFSKQFGSFFIDSLCTLSVAGIWPRFIEPRLLKQTSLEWELPPSASHLDGLRLVQFSDLHFHRDVPSYFLKKIIRKIQNAKPDLVLFTGDFLCYSHLEEKERLQEFLCQCSAPLGNFCTFGNHDYASYVSRNKAGVYDVLKPMNPALAFFKGFASLFQEIELKGHISKQAESVPFHADLCALLEKTPFHLLENTSVTLPFGLNIVGLGDYALGRFRPETAFAGYNSQFPGIVLSHNPDTFSRLTSFPGEWILSGHTHGEQIHFPFPPMLRAASKKLTRAENPEFTRGMYAKEGKILYVNRGVGCHKPLRFCSPPEILVVTLRKSI